MDNQKPSKEDDSRKQVTKTENDSQNKPENPISEKNDSNILDKKEISSSTKEESPPIKKKTEKPPKLEDKPFEEFINKHLIPGLKSSIDETGTLVTDIKLVEGERPVVGGNCWMVFCVLSEQRKFWLCFNKDIITSDKTILLAESNSDPSIVESFLIDEKKITLPLLISRVLQRLNGQKWLGSN